VARGVSAKRYAQAVFEIALERDGLDRWQSDLKKIARLGENARLVSFLESPKFRFDDKAKLLSELLGDINPLVLNLGYLLITKGRFRLVGEIVEGFERRLDSYRGIERAEVATAIPLGDEDKQKLAGHLEAVIGKKVVLEAKVDASLIGGVIARVGGKLLDGSTRSKLEALKRELVGSAR
jgi:F-type H+-transporting ATPase subunit delta